MAGFFASLLRPLTDEKDVPFSLLIAGCDITVTLRRNSQAKRMIIRLSKDGTGVVVTMPPRLSRARAQLFVEQSKPWIARQLHAQVAAMPLGADATVPLRGIPHRVVATGQSRGVVEVDEESRTIRVPGSTQHITRRLADWLKAQAKADLTAASARYAAAMNTTIRRISVRDQRSRWGSCSAQGDLSYNWRLILAPDYVLNYVAAHEVAHRLHMNHGPKFWRLVLTHDPHAGRAKTWLKTNGRNLHTFQVNRAHAA
jgi:predicted metal-dependent hydrolase